ncbi:hypothetical protein QBC46DRAFT_375260 [Diplogelasinospora grovesii]|uniref:Sulfate transporter protein n=1 Tax=Diplogelasinospora grovesii TaxID=303347 RepID=A0AAN6NH94_9PEZI|nr:hypothetical protein QBC46DRAFT_375260 [Diplogelasinospora grovesii]
MAVFIDLEDDEIEPPNDAQPSCCNGIDAIKVSAIAANADEVIGMGEDREEAHELAVRENPNRNSMTEALGCYPIVMSVAANIDLNTLDNLSRTCRQIRVGLLQYRKMLLISTLHCVNESIPVDPEETLRYRARAGNWFYMEEAGRTQYSGKSGQCARDLVSECRRCGTVVCRNCAIKPPAPIVLRDRHRRLCVPCTKAPLGSLVEPRLGAEFTVESDDMQRAICQCASEGVWLCQPCGRSIRGDDYSYKGIWRWRNQYGEVLGGLGTGIGEGDRGVICGRESECCAAREREQETDCDAEDAREADGLLLGTTPTHSATNSNGSLGLWSGPGSVGSLSSLSSTGGGYTPTGTPGPDRRTPSPALKPGYERHEIEGIGGVMKKKLLRMVKIGACVPEWEDEKARGEILGREVQGRVRSWCGWCWRVIPGKKDFEMAKATQAAGKGKDKETCL